MDEQRLAEIEAAHAPLLNRGRRWCYACDRPAPCDAVSLASEVRRLWAEVDEAARYTNLLLGRTGDTA